MSRPRTKPAPELPACTQRLQQIVKESGLTRADFARKIGMTPGGFGNVFLRPAEVTGVQARAVAYEFGINPEWILSGTGPKRNLRTNESNNNFGVIRKRRRFSLRNNDSCQH